MKITSITYSRLVSTERFGNVRVEATASLDPTDDRDEAFKELRQWVDLEVLTKKHKIEGTIEADPDDDDPPFSASAQRRAQLHTPPPQRAQMNGASISAQQVRTGSIVRVNGSGQAMTIDPATGGLLLASNRAQPDARVRDLMDTFGNQAIPAHGRREVVFHNHHQAEITLFDKDSRAITGIGVEGNVARAFLNIVDGVPAPGREEYGGGGYQRRDINGMDGTTVALADAESADSIAAWYDEHRRTGNAWERADRARAGLPPHQPWLLAQHSTDPHVGDRLEFHDFAQPRVDRAFKAGWLLDAIDQGLLIPNGNGPVLMFGAGGEDAFSAAAPSFYDDGDEEEDCPACNGQGHNKHTLDDCDFCEGDGTVSAERAAAWRLAQ